MVLKIEPNWPVTVPIRFDRLDRKVVESELDRLNRWSD